MEADAQTGIETQAGEASPQPKGEPDIQTGEEVQNGGASLSEEEVKAGEEAANAEAETKAEIEVEKAVETKTVLIRHKTPYPKYRCAGLVLTQRPEARQVTETQLEKLRNDPWVVIDKEPEPK
jgi:hypothetical protein